METQYQMAIREWRQLLGDDAVIDQASTLSTIRANCTGLEKSVPAVLKVARREQIPDIVKIAARHSVPIQPYSTGNNWGYGSKNPALDHVALLDLTGLNRIIEFDAETGLLTIEPGVTQRQLADFLNQNNQHFLIPVTGAGPDCSILGNALERGYGITPYTDHFGAVTSLEAVLPNGDIYRSMLSNLAGTTLDGAFKWGLGPYLDGLFTQSNFGIVTQATLSLAAKPQQVEAFFFRVKADADLEDVAARVRQLLRQLGSVVGSINLMNSHRMLSMSEPYPKHAIGADGLIPAEQLATMMRRNRLTHWTGVGAIYASKRIAAAARKEIRQILEPIAARLDFVTPRKAQRLHRLALALPLIRTSNWPQIFATLNKTMLILTGEPSEVALPLAYWRSGDKPSDGSRMNPDRDRCGLIWFAPLVPMKTQACSRYVEMVKSVCAKHGIEPLITLTSLSERCWNSSMPILFDRNDAKQQQQAYACYEELLETGRQLGFVPYRLGAHSMDFPSRHHATPELLKQLKHAIDPKNIIAPGRYGL